MHRDFAYLRHFVNYWQIDKLWWVAEFLYVDEEINCEVEVVLWIRKKENNNLK